MKKQSSTKFWISFIVASVVFLSGWFLFWEVKNGHLNSLRAAIGFLPANQETKTDFQTLVSVAQSLMDTDGQEKTYLILFQNNLELRPGGGFIGSFGILKVLDGHIVGFAVHDTGNFDGRIPDTVEPPYPMKETLNIPSWKFRDSNYSPDFATNAAQAEMFYAMGQGSERFDGVIGITSDTLASFLSVTGPVEIPGFPGTYSADNAVLDLEYQVEQGYEKQGIDFGDRKSVMAMLGLEILERAKNLSMDKKYELFQVLLDDLHRKDIQIVFKDDALQSEIEKAGWSGSFDGSWNNDYLYLVDANLNSWKSDYAIKRSYEYTVDMSGDTPQATLAATYEHTAKSRDWFVKDYQTFLRVYVPKGSYLSAVDGNAKDPVYGEFMGKKYFGTLVQVPLGTTKTVTFHYVLPQDIGRDVYDLKIQKQPGMSDVPVHVVIIGKDGTKIEQRITLAHDTVLSDEE
jgi:hypothetical protein